MYIVTEAEIECGMCPFQLYGTTTHGEDVYVRERFGHLTIRINDDEVFYKEVGMAFDGVTDLAEATKGAFVWPYCLTCWRAVALSEQQHHEYTRHDAFLARLIRSRCGW